LVFGFSKNQILVAVILGQNSFWIIAKNHFEMSTKSMQYSLKIQQIVIKAFIAQSFLTYPLCHF
jgi:hypothetical protein